MKLRLVRFVVTCAVSAAVTAPLYAAPQPALLGFSSWSANGQNIWVVGGYDSGQKKWLNDSAAQTFFYPGTKFSFFDMKDRRGETVIDRAQLEEVPRGYFAAARRKLDGEGMAVAVANVPTPMPRTPRAQSLESSIYVNAMTGLLRRSGWTGNRARLMQHYRVDLNGDGNEEVLLRAQSSAAMGSRPTAKKGDYSMVAVRFYDSSRKTNAVQIASLQSEIVKTDIEFGAPESHEILSCVDSNGDGAMEVVVRSQYYEGESISVFAFDGHRVKRVLAAGWGV